jgi:hypothetical protein
MFTRLVAVAKEEATKDKVEVYKRLSETTEAEGGARAAGVIAFYTGKRRQP